MSHSRIWAGTLLLSLVVAFGLSACGGAVYGPAGDDSYGYPYGWVDGGGYWGPGWGHWDHHHWGHGWDHAGHVGWGHGFAHGHPGFAGHGGGFGGGHGGGGGGHGR